MTLELTNQRTHDLAVTDPRKLEVHAFAGERTGPLLTRVTAIIENDYAADDQRSSVGSPQM